MVKKTAKSPNHVKFGSAAAILSTVIACACVSGCRPCGCTDAQMDAATRAVASEAKDEQIEKAVLHFDWNPFTLDDDPFSFTVTYQSRTSPAGFHAETITSAYKKSGGTVTFTEEGGISTILQKGVPYRVECKGKKLILRRRGSHDLAFDCSN
jgi:hypothetical protein